MIGISLTECNNIDSQWIGITVRVEKYLKKLVVRVKAQTNDPGFDALLVKGTDFTSMFRFQMYYIVQQHSLTFNLKTKQIDLHF